MADQTIKGVFQLRHDTAATWTSKNPVLRLAEPGIETDTGRQKVGDGVTPWSGLPYFSEASEWYSIQLGMSPGNLRPIPLDIIGNAPMVILESIGDDEFKRIANNKDYRIAIMRKKRATQASMRQRRDKTACKLKWCVPMFSTSSQNIPESSQWWPIQYKRSYIYNVADPWEAQQQMQQGVFIQIMQFRWRQDKYEKHRGYVFHSNHDSKYTVGVAIFKRVTVAGRDRWRRVSNIAGVEYRIHDTQMLTTRVFIE